MKNIVKLILELADQQINIFLEDGKLKIDAPNGIVLDAVIAKVKLHKDDIIEYLSGNNNQKVVEIPKATLSDDYPLSSSQRRLWVISQFGETGEAYNIPAVFEFEGVLDMAALSKSFDSLIMRHEILRTVFRQSPDGEIRQSILSTKEAGFRIGNHSLRKADEATVKQLVHASLSRSFDLENGPLLRADIYQLSDSKYIFSYAMHHIISDGWSMEVLIKELLQLYNAHVQGHPNPLRSLRIHYKDYAVWQQNQLKKESFHKHKKYWLQQLSGELPVLDLPTDKIRPALKTYNGASLHKQIDTGIATGLKELCQSADSTMFMGLLAAVNVLLYRYTSQNDIVIGSPIAGREHSDLEGQIGFYVNTLALRTQLSAADSFRQLLVRIKQTTIDAYAHQGYPFDALVEELDLKRDLSRNALFDVMIVLQQQSSTLRIEKGLKGLQIRAYEGMQRGSKVDLQFTFVEADDQLELYINYNTDLYHEETISQLMTHFQQLLASIIAAPGQAIGSINYLSLSEHQLLDTFNNTDVTYTLNRTIIDLFEEQVLCTPDATAVVFESNILSYRELNELTNQFSGYLKQVYNIGTGDLVCLGLERNEWMPVTILSILKAGAAYIPIDRAYPQERIDFIIKDADSKVFIDEGELDKFKSVQSNYDKSFTSVRTGPDSIAYCIYTSGSTGSPKGVLNSHGGIYNRLLWMKDYLGVTSEDVFLQKTPYTFDVSVWELLLPFITGSTLVVAPPDKHKDPVYLQEVIAERGVTIAHFVPSMLGMFLIDAGQNKCQTLKHIVCSGEELPASMVMTCRGKLKNVRIHNFYGPTEAAIDVTAIDLTEVDVEQRGVSIGAPVANTKIYIVNESLQLQPIGIPGELLISGIQVANGYLHLEQLTEARFIDDPFTLGNKVYRTGDVAKWLPDGTIQYLGRIDDQVKIRGNRIELGEVENALSTYTAVESGIVAVRKVNGEKMLIAYYTSEAPIDKIKLRQYLQQKLPDFMVPAYYVALTEVPLTASGKVNRKALPVIKEEDVIRREYVAPHTAIEEKLVNIWQEILKRERVGVTDSFFELGGHSLKAISLLSVIHKEFGVSINVKTLFKHPIIRSLAEHIENVKWLEETNTDHVVEKMII